ncbi:unnamed protein product [Ixodes pacificus]
MSLNISLAVVDDSLAHPLDHIASEGGIRVATKRGPSTTVSRLQVPEAATGDSDNSEGKHDLLKLVNYSCIPLYAD